MLRVPLVLLSLVFLHGCGSDPTTGPTSVRWDRETCTRCAMAVGDRRFSAQVREDQAPFRVHLFDDIGCAVIWLDQNPEKDSGNFEIWVNDHLTGEWVDARQAGYVSVNQSPMGYNLGAVSEASTNALDYTAAVAHIRNIESSQRIHGGGGHQASSNSQTTAGSTKP